MAKALLKEALSGSKIAVEAIDRSETAHITFQKVRSTFAWLSQLWLVLNYAANNDSLISDANLQVVALCVVLQDELLGSAKH